MKYRPLPERFEDFIERIPFHSCWEWMGQLNNKGYAMIWDKDRNQSVVASRIAYLLYIGDIPKGLYVCHSCDNRSCVNPNHLWLGTPKDNTQDMINKGRVQRGLEVKGKRKLRLEEVVQIKRLYKKGVKGWGHKALAKKYGMSQSAIRDIISGKSWNYIDPDWARMEDVK